MKKLLFLLTVLLFAKDGFTQNAIDYNNYQPLKCAGEVPADFRTRTSTRYEKSLHDEAIYSRTKDIPEGEANFLLQNDYTINNMLLSGKVMFGDTITEYINRVADQVLINDPELRTKLSFYCLRSYDANAFSTYQGVVFVTIGLMAQLENEAQLAFVLSHEIAHYERRHVIKSYLHTDSVFNEYPDDVYNSYDDQIRHASTYSKEFELEADSLGLIRLSKTVYDCKESVGSLFVLQFSELPFEDYPFNPAFLEAPFMKFPNSLFLDSVRPINLNGDMDDDSYSTHPNMATRKKRLEKIQERLNSKNVDKFHEDEKWFYCVRKISRFESVRLMLNDRQYAAALYNCYVLMREDPTSKYLKLSVGKALYGMAKYKNQEKYSETAGYYGKKEGNQQQCYYLFEKMKPAQLNMVALRYLYNLSLTDNSAFVTGMRDDLALEAVSMNEVSMDEMKKTFVTYNEAKNAPKDTAQQQKQTTQQTQAAEPGAFVSKYDKIRTEKKKQDQDDATTRKFYLLAFADILDSSRVINLFANAEKAKAALPAKKPVDDEEDEDDGEIDYKEISATSSSSKPLAYKLGQDTIVFIDPFYLTGDDKHGFMPLLSERELFSFDSLIQVKGESGKIECSYLMPKEFDVTDVDKYNDLMTMNAWVAECGDHGDMKFIPGETNYSTELSRKYHTKYFCWVGVTVEKKETYYYMYIYDVTGANPKVYQSVYLHGKPDEKVLSNFILYTIRVAKTN